MTAFFYMFIRHPVQPQSPGGPCFSPLPVSSVRFVKVFRRFVCKAEKFRMVRKSSPFWLKALTGYVRVIIECHKINDFFDTVPGED